MKFESILPSFACDGLQSELGDFNSLAKTQIPFTQKNFSRVLRFAIVCLKLCLLSSLLHSSPATSQDSPAWVAKLISIEGDVKTRKSKQTEWLTATIDDTFTIGDSVHMQGYSRAAIQLPDGVVMRLDQNTTVTFIESRDQNRSWLELIGGIIHIISRVPRALEVVTPFANAGIEGTEFSVQVTNEEVVITVFEGEVSVRSESGEAIALSGESIIATGGQKPVSQLAVRSQDAVQWMLYFSPILDENLPAADLEVPADQTADSFFYSARAAKRLSVGRLNEAEADISKSLGMNAANVDAIALQSIIALALNDKDMALTLANKAVAGESRSVAALLALSYAQQARFELSSAVSTLQTAVEIDSTNSLAWARLSELWLALGDLDKSVHAAQMAIEIDPNLSLTQTVLGFAYLAQFDIDLAMEAFQKAITLDQAAPLPRLGLGLALIRNGKLQDGRGEIETAVILDPGNSLTRSYMGKAYYEEKRNGLAESQLDIAKALDPMDPTPWFYDAVRKQAVNRPVEALRDLHHSIAINDNRAVFRSRLALDGDLATRSTGVARIYDNLGFDQLARTVATSSISLDPSNHSAHRFMSDAYAKLPRHQIARVSELLQSQLLQPVNISPVRPSLPFADLTPATRIGTVETGLNEYSSLFERDGINLLASGLVGNQESVGGEVVAFGMSDDFSFSAGASGIDTDGFRENNDQKDDIYNVFGQWAATSDLMFQAEIRHRDTKQGDPELNFNPAEFFPEDRRVVKKTASRIGVNVSNVPGSTFLLSGIYAELEEQLVFVDEFDGSITTTDDRGSDHGYQVELQHILKHDRSSLITGIGALRSDVSFSAIQTTDGVVDDIFVEDFEQEQQNVYIYGDLTFPDQIRWTVGAGYIKVSQGQQDFEDVVPKLGVEWDVTDSVTLRSAFFETIKRPLIVEQTIEPTEVAGFNQLFDDTNGSKSRRSGLGMDMKMHEKYYFGIEASRRDIDYKVGDDIEKQQENSYSAYFNYTISDRWAFSIYVTYEDYRSREPVEFDVDAPLRLKTWSLPISVRYFSPRGFFAQLQATYLTQDLERGATASRSDGEENVGLLDVAVGYRLPQRRGTISLSMQNALDKPFFYQDDSFRSSDVTQSSIYIPERQVVLLATLVF